MLSHSTSKFKIYSCQLVCLQEQFGSAYFSTHVVRSFSSEKWKFQENLNSLNHQRTKNLYSDKL